MTIITDKNMNDTILGLKSIFMKSFETTSSVSDELAMRINSSSKNESYQWISAFPILKEWIGERSLNHITGGGFLIKNRDFEATVSVLKNDIEDESIGTYVPLFSQLGATAKQHPDSLIMELILAGFNNSGYDGVSFFSTQHPGGPNSSRWSNRSNKSLSHQGYAEVRAEMASLKDAEGRSLKITATHLIVPPELEKMAREIVTASNKGNNESNIWKDTAKLIVAPELQDNPNGWYLADLSKPIKPFVLQIRRTPDFISLDQAENHNVFLRKEYLYGIDYRGNAGYGLPQLIHAADPS